MGLEFLIAEREKDLQSATDFLKVFGTHPTAACFSDFDKTMNALRTAELDLG